MRKNKVDLMFEVWTRIKLEASKREDAFLFDDFVVYLKETKQLKGICEKYIKELMKCCDKYSTSFIDVVKYLNSKDLEGLIDKNVNTILSCYKNPEDDLDSLLVRYPSILKRNAPRILLYYFRNRLPFDTLAKYVRTRVVLIEHFDKVIDYSIRSNLSNKNIRSNPSLVDFGSFVRVLSYMPHTILDKYFDKIFECYVKNKQELSSLAEISPKVVDKNFDEIFDFYVKNKWEFDDLVCYTPDTIRRNFDRIRDYYIKNKWKLDDLVEEIIYDRKRVGVG